MRGPSVHPLSVLAALFIDHQQANSFPVAIGRAISQDEAMTKSGAFTPNMANASENALQAHMLEAFNHLQSGRPAEAERCCKAILAQHPNIPETLNLGGIAAYHAGHLDQAHRLLKKAIKIKPNWADAHANAGLVLMGMGKLLPAINAFERAIKLEPGHINARVNHARALHADKRVEKAEEAIRETLKLDPSSAEGWNVLAIVLQAQDDVIGAEEALREAIRLAPGHTNAIVNLAFLLETANRPEDISAIYDAAAKAGVKTPRLDLIMAKALRRLKDDVGAQAMLERLSGFDLSPIIMRSVHGELGWLADRAGDVERAFEHFKQCNAYAKALCPPSIDNMRIVKEARASRIMLDGAAVPSPTPLDGVPDPVFMVGFPRSGTTLLDQILSSHPRVATIEEGPMADAVVKRAAAMVKGYPKSLFSLTDDQRRELAELYWQQARQYGEWRDGDLLIDKLPLNVRHVPLLWMLFPRAKFILVLRHPADACLSCFMHEFALNDAMANFLDYGDATVLYDAVMGLWRDANTALPLMAHTVRYEDVVDDMEGEARKLIAFLDQTWTDDVLNYRQTAMDKGLIHTPSYHQVVQPIYSHARYRWTRYADLLDATALERLAPFAEAFGYSEGGEEPST